eukprot:14629092-Alexandrium_andersonii.AAC.1
MVSARTPGTARQPRPPRLDLFVLGRRRSDLRGQRSAQRSRLLSLPGIFTAQGAQCAIRNPRNA